MGHALECTYHADAEVYYYAILFFFFNNKWLDIQNEMIKTPDYCPTLNEYFLKIRYFVSDAVHQAYKRAYSKFNFQCYTRAHG